MKLTLNTTEVQEAVSNFIISNGFPVDMTNAVITITNDGADISFEKLDEVEPPKAVRKAKKPVKKEIEEPIIEEEAVEVEVEEKPETDVVLDELDITDPVEESVEGDNDFSLFG